MKQKSTQPCRNQNRSILHYLLFATVLLFTGTVLQAQNPLAPANNFMIFVQNNSTVTSGDVTGPFATGGNLTVNGNFQSAGNDQGTYKATASESLVGTLVGGSVFGSSYFQTNGNSFAKVGNLGSSTCDASSLLFIKNGSNHVLSGNNAQTCSQVSNLGALNFSTAFTTLKNTAACLAAKSPTVTLPSGNNPVITLATGVNYLTLSAAQLNSSINLTTSPTADATHILVINANVGSSFTWSGGFQLQRFSATPYVLINFNTTATINFNQIGSSLAASILAPFATFNKNASNNIEGQIIASNYNHASGEVHESAFLGHFSCTTPSTSCSCPGNVVLNPSFEDGTTGWHWSGGTFTDGTGATVCGSNSGDFNITNSSHNYVRQTIGTDLAVGTVITGSVYAGTHNNSFYHEVGITFYNSSWVEIGSATKEVNKVLGASPAGPQQYTFSGTVPSGTKYTTVGGSGTGDWIKMDQWCVTVTSPVTGIIGDRVWLDADADGIQDASETGGVSGVTVQLRNSGGTVIDTEITGSTGAYSFTGLSAGTYTVVFPTTITGGVLTAANVGSDDAIDSDPSTSTGITANISLASGQHITNVDAGYIPTTLQLGNRVWYDTNNDGIFSNEDGIANVTVRLYKDANNDDVPDGASVATEITGTFGEYKFENLTPGNYIVGVVTPNGYMSSSVNGGDPGNNINSDDNGQITVGNETRGLAITLAAGTEPGDDGPNSNYNNTYDFGFLPDCICTNGASNLLVNESFENGTTGWSWSGGTLTTGTGYVACGAANGFNNSSSGLSKVWQDVNVAPGATITFKAFAGTHTPGISCSPKLSLIFLNASNAVLNQTDVVVTRDVDKNYSQLEQYTITGVAPAGTVKVRVQSSITCDVMKLDALCLTTSCVAPTAPTAVVTQPTCASPTGSITLSGLPSSGTWTLKRNPGNVTTTGSGTTTTISGLTAGTYTFTVTNAGGCTSGVTSATLNTPPATPAAPTAVVTHPTCASPTGSITLSGLPSSGTWTLTRNPGNVTSTGSGATTIVSGLAAGTYTFTVTNATGCTSGVTSATLNAQPATPTAPTAAVTHPTCASPTGSITLSGLPSSGNWTLTRNPGNVTTTGSGTTTTVSGLAAGTYTFTVTNASGCTSGVTSATLNASPATPAAPTAMVTHPTCTSSTGSITLSGLPSSGTWTLTRNPGNVITTGSGTTTTISGLAAGTYTFTVTNAAGCTSQVTSATLDPQPGRASVGDFAWVDANSNGLIDGNDINLPLAGILVSLFNDANGDGTPDAGAINTFTTLTDGKYLFTNLCPGNYVIQFGTKNGYARTTQLNNSSKDLSDSDPNVNSGLTPTIRLTPGENDLSVDAGYTSTVILPVTFGLIKAQARNCEVYIDFEVLTQKNTRQFEIEYSKDGTSWSNIAIIAAKGNSAASYNYAFRHTQPKTGTNLYRIKAVDADGKFMYSEAFSAVSNCSGKGSVVTYPNPAYDVLTVVLTSDLQGAELQLFNSVGQIVLSDSKKSGLVRLLNTGNLHSGVYLLKIIQDKKVVATHKILKAE